MKKKYLIVLIIVILFIVPTMSIASSFFTENENQPVTSKKLNYLAYEYIYEDTIFPLFNKKRDVYLYNTEDDSRFRYKNILTSELSNAVYNKDDDSISISKENGYYNFKRDSTSSIKKESCCEVDLDNTSYYTENINYKIKKDDRQILIYNSDSIIIDKIKSKLPIVRLALSDNKIYYTLLNDEKYFNADEANELWIYNITTKEHKKIDIELKDNESISDIYRDGDYIKLSISKNKYEEAAPRTVVKDVIDKKNMSFTVFEDLIEISNKKYGVVYEENKAEDTLVALLKVDKNNKKLIFPDKKCEKMSITLNQDGLYCYNKKDHTIIRDNLDGTNNNYKLDPRLKNKDYTYVFFKEIKTN